MSGRGAWPFFYKLGLDRRNDPQGRDAHGIYALKKELIYNGYSKGVVPTLPYWGSSVDAVCKQFQKDHGLTVDGELGPHTALVLFRKRTLAVAAQYGLPQGTLCPIKTVESSNDPVAQGFADTDDEGLLQINIHFHPDITIEQAWSPLFALDFGAKYLRDGIAYCDADVDGGIASYNIGRIYAKQWVEAGKPASGGPPIGSDDSYTRATQYVHLVKSAAC